jgi:hypothetical protein
MLSRDIALNFFSLKLTVIKLSVESVFCRQLAVFALLDDVTVIHDQNPIGVADG